MASSPESSLGTLLVSGSHFLSLWFACGLGVPRDPCALSHSASGGAERVDNLNLNTAWCSREAGLSASDYDLMRSSQWVPD